MPEKNAIPRRPMPMSYIGIWLLLSVIALGRTYGWPASWSLGIAAEFTCAVIISTALWSWIFWWIGLRKVYPFKR